MIRLKQTHTATASIFFVLVVMCLFFSCKKESDPDISYNYFIEVFQNGREQEIYGNGYPKRYHEAVRYNTLFEDNNLTFVLKPMYAKGDLSNVKKIEWHVNSTKYTGEKIEFYNVKPGTMLVKVIVYTKSKEKVRAAVTGEEIDIGKKQVLYIGLSEEVKILPKPSYFVEPFTLYNYEKLEHTDSVSNKTYTTQVNWAYYMDGEDMGRAEWAEFISITLPVGELLEEKSYSFITDPKTQEGPMLNYLFQGSNSAYINWPLKYVKHKLGFPDNDNFFGIDYHKSPSTDNYFNVEDIITEGSTKIAVGDFKFNEEVQGKFRIRVE